MFPNKKSFRINVSNSKNFLLFKGVSNLLLKGASHK